MTILLQAKAPGDHLQSQPVDLAVDFATALGAREGAYERLLDDAMDGDPRRFARQDMVEEQWRIVSRILAHDDRVLPYEPGSWGPVEAELLAAPYGGWHDPGTVEAPRWAPPRQDHAVS